MQLPGAQDVSQVTIFGMIQAILTIPIATQMANGQNFWVELAKQLKAGDDQNQKPKASGEQSRKGK